TFLASAAKVPTSPRSGRPEHVSTTSRSTSGSRPYCQVHGARGHTTEECRTLQARKQREESQVSDAQTTPTASRSGPVTRSQTAQLTCFHCQQKGHIATNCPDKKPVIKRAVVKETDDVRTLQG